MARPEIYRKKADPHRTDLRAVKKWINNELQRLLPDDDIVIDYLIELIEDDSPDIDYIDSQMTEFLGAKEGRKFCKQLWERMTGLDKEKDVFESDTKSATNPNDEKKTNYNRSIEREGSQEGNQENKEDNKHRNRERKLGNQESRERNREKSPTRSRQSFRSHRHLGSSRKNHDRTSLELKDFRRQNHW